MVEITFFCGGKGHVCFSFVWQHFRLCSFWLQQQAQMASTLEKQLVASQNFLGGCRNLPAFQTIRQRQWEVLSKALDKVDGLSTEKAAQIIGILDEDLWGSFSESLKSAVALKENSQEQRERKQVQDYTNLVLYLPERVWQSLAQDSRHVALEKVCKHAVALGLKHPSEQTVALILALVYDQEGQLLESDRWDLLQKQKGQIKKLLSKSSPPMHLEKLPEDPKELTDTPLWEMAFTGELPVKSSRTDLLLQIARSWPLRKTNRAASSVSTRPATAKGQVVSPLKQPAFVQAAAFAGQLVAGLMGSRTQSSQDLSHLSQGNSGRAASETAVESQRCLAKVPVLALENLQADAVSLDKPKKQGSTKAEAKMSVSQSLAALKKGLAEDVESDDASGVETKDISKKRPAAQKPRIGKRPASTQKAGSICKKPSSKKVAAKEEPRSEKLSRSELKKQLLKIVPLTLKRKYSAGCTTCRNTPLCTPSCWQKRGFSL